MQATPKKDTLPDARADVEHRILIVDDDLELGRALQLYLSGQGFRVALATTGAQGRKFIGGGAPDLVLLDVNLPDECGFDIARDIRRVSSVPIVMLTARRDEVDRVVGLNMGADDYIVKPFSVAELTARIRAVLRRMDSAGGQAVGRERRRRIATFGDWRVELDRHKVLSPTGLEVRLTLGEFALLKALLHHPKKVRTREQLLIALGEKASDSFDRAIDIRIARLRSKIEADKKKPTIISTVRGVGYLFTQSVAWQ